MELSHAWPHVPTLSSSQFTPEDRLKGEEDAPLDNFVSEQDKLLIIENLTEHHSYRTFIVHRTTFHSRSYAL